MTTDANEEAALEDVINAQTAEEGTLSGLITDLVANQARIISDFEALRSAPGSAIDQTAFNATLDRLKANTDSLSSFSATLSTADQDIQTADPNLPTA